jgi:hypothetical protein
MMDEEIVFYTSTSLIVIALIFLIIWFRKPIIYMFTSASGLIMLFILFIISDKTNDSKNNPVAILIIYLMLPVLVLIFANLADQTKYISIGITTKQHDSIKIYKTTNQRLLHEEAEIDINIAKLDNTNLSKRVKNIFSFVWKRKPKSILYQNFI